MQTATAEANAAAVGVAHTLGDPAEPPSCTFVAAVVADAVITVAWCGDSRAYWLPDAGEARQLTVDHSLGTELLAAGESRAEAEADPAFHTITRWLGADSVEHSPGVRLADDRRSRAGCWCAATACGTTPRRSTRWSLLVAETLGDGRHGDPVQLAGALVDWANAAGRPRQHHRRSGPLRPISYCLQQEEGHHVAEFKAEVFQNEFLAEGATDVHAVVSVTAPAPGPPGRRVTARPPRSSSSTRRARWTCRRRRSSRRAGPRRWPSSEIVDGTWFAVISGHSVAQMVYPIASRHGQDDRRHPARGHAHDRQPAARGGATAIGAWIAAATELFAQVETGAAPRDPADRRQDRGRAADVRCHEALAAAQGKFQCDCRGIGSDWVVDELRTIADALLGTVDIIAEPDELEADFEAMIRTSMSRGVRRCPAAGVGAAGQRGAVRPPGRARRSRTSRPRPRRSARWSASSRPARGATRAATTTWPCGCRVAPLGNERLAARVEVVVNDEVVAKSLVKATWSADANLTTRIDPAVAHYTGQAQLADAIQKGLAAKAAGDERTATVLLGEAAKIAHDSGNEDTTRLLAKVVDVVDAEAGTVRLKSNVERTDEMALDTRSTKTTRIRKEP